MTAENPYVGPRPFERDDADLFFGRARDARDLASLVVAHRVVLLYSASGAGKSSLVNAGVVPLLERKRFEVLPSARLGAPVDGPHANVFAATLAAQLGAADGSIVAALQARTRSLDEEGEQVPRALVIDQFEELFTAHPELWSHRSGLFDALREALETDERLRVLLVMREEYLAQLEPYSQRLPGGLRARFRLERLDRHSALEAVTRPLEGTGRSFAPRVAESFVDDLLRLRVDTGSGEMVEVMGEFIEPVHLQVVCSRLWAELPAGVTEIHAEHARALAELDTVLARFYDDALAAAHAEAGVSERELRGWVRDELITPGGTRSTVYRGRDSTAGLPNKALKALEDKRLVRAEQRANALWYELTHDRMIGPIRRSNAAFAAADSRRRLRRVYAAFGAIALVLAAVAAVLAANGVQESAPATGVCGSCSARFGTVSVQPDVTFGSYLRLTGIGPGNAGRPLDERGVLIRFELELRGKGRTFPVSSQVVDANSGNIVSEQAQKVLPESEPDQALLSLWLPRPKQEGLFEVNLSVFPPGAPTGSLPLSTATSGTFAGAHEGGSGIVATFRVLRSGNGSGSVVGPDITCGTICSAQYPFGSTISLVAEPAPGSVFAGWEGACGHAPTCELVVGAVTSIRARFEKLAETPVE